MLLPLLLTLTTAQQDLAKTTIKLRSIEASVSDSPRLQAGENAVVVYSPTFKVTATVDAHLADEQWAVGIVQVCNRLDSWASYESGSQHWVAGKSDPSGNLVAAANFEEMLDSADSYPWARSSSRKYLSPKSHGNVDLSFEDGPSTTTPQTVTYDFLRRPEKLAQVGRGQSSTVYVVAQNVSTGKMEILAELVWKFDYGADPSAAQGQNPFFRNVRTCLITYFANGASARENGKTINSASEKAEPFPTAVLKRPSLNNAQELWWQFFPEAGTSKRGRELRIE